MGQTSKARNWSLTIGGESPSGGHALAKRMESSACLKRTAIISGRPTRGKPGPLIIGGIAVPNAIGKANPRKVSADRARPRERSWTGNSPSESSGRLWTIIVLVILAPGPESGSPGALAGAPNRWSMPPAIGRFFPFPSRIPTFVMNNSFVVRYGQMRHIGEYEAVEGRSSPSEGSVSIVRSDRGTEVGEVLCPATDRTASFLENPFRGQILRESRRPKTLRQRVPPD